MASLGTAIGLQGQYDNTADRAVQLAMQRDQIQQQKIANEQRAAQQREEDFAKSIDPYTKLEADVLPFRQDELEEKKNKLLYTVIEKRKNNPLYNPKFDKEIEGLRNDYADMKSSYEWEKDLFEKNALMASTFPEDYDEETVERYSVLNSRDPFDIIQAKKEFGNKLYGGELISSKTFVKSDWRKNIDAENPVPTISKNVTRMEGGKYITENIKGVDIDTPEKMEAANVSLIGWMESDNPYAKRLKYEARQKARNEVGFDKLSPEDKETFINGLAFDELKRYALKDAPQTTDKESIISYPKGGLQLNFTGGGGMSGGKLNISDPVLVKSTPEETKPEFIKKVYRNMLDNQIKIQVDGKEAKLGRKLTDSEKDAIVQQVNLAENVGRAKKRAEEMYDNGENLRYYSVQLQGGGKNPAFNFGGQSGTVEGVLVDDGGYVKQVRMKQTGKGGVVQTRDIRLRAEDDFSNYKGNLGNEFDQWLNHNSFKLPFSQKGNKGTVKIVEGYEIPEGAVIKRSKNTGKIVGYELNGKKYQF